VHKKYISVTLNNIVNAKKSTNTVNEPPNKTMNYENYVLLFLDKTPARRRENGENTKSMGR
jgi:enterochelin esterase-like enzyme